MLTSPVRTIISLNTSSKIMFGFREVQGSRPFDGATSQYFYTPYSTVVAGNDIGFVEEAQNHDAGLMMQWNLGSTPGTYTGSFQQFSARQGTNLNAALAETYTQPGDPVDLNISIVNSELSAVNGLGYTLTLPAGLLVNAAATSSCGGTLTANTGTNSIVLSGVTVSGAANCVVTVPVAAASAGAYTITTASVSGLAGALTNNLGASTLNVGVRTLSFATQGGSNVNDMAVTQGGSVTLPGVTRTSHVFNGWNTAPDGSGTNYAAGANFVMPSADTTLYAQWQAVYYGVTFVEQGGNPETDLTNVMAGATVTLPEPERDGYEFIEWNTAANGSGTDYQPGDITMPANNLTLYALWEDSDGISMETENSAPNSGDANGDGLLDSQQGDVSSVQNIVTGKPATLAVESEGNSCFLSDVSVVAASGLGTDSSYTYPVGLFDFAVDCGTDGFTATVKQYFYDMSASNFALRKFINGSYQTVSGASFATQTIGGRQVLVVSYEVTDGGPLDADGEVNGVVVDPAGPAVPVAAPGVPNTGVKPGLDLIPALGTGLLGLILTGAGIIGLVLRRRARDDSV